MKSDSNSQRVPNWSLKKTLSRNFSHRVFQVDDARWLWAAYSLGLMPRVKEGLDAEDFRKFLFMEYVRLFPVIVLFFGEDKERPLGFGTGFPLHRQISPVTIYHETHWFAWASPRDRVTASVEFLNTARKTSKMLFISHDKDKKFMAVLAKHGVINRIGTSHYLFNPGKVSVWETRGLKDGHS